MPNCKNNKTSRRKHRYINRTLPDSQLSWGGPEVSSTVLSNGLNVVVNNAISFEVANTPNHVTITGGLQIINNNGARFSKVPSNVIADKIWILNSKKNSGGTLDVTEITGTFKVSDKKYAYTEFDGQSPVYFGAYTITLPEGTYNIGYADSVDEIKKKLGTPADTSEGLKFYGWKVSGNTITPNFTAQLPAEKNYYVLAGGTGDGRSPNTPAKSVEAVIPAINADLPHKNDIAHVYIMQKQDAEALEYGAYSQTTSNFTPWIADRSGANEVLGYPVYSHEAKMIVSSYKYEETGIKKHLIFSDYIGAMHHLRLMGPTEFKDIILLGNRVPSTIVARGYSVSFENTDFKASNANGFEPTSQHTTIYDGYITFWAIDGSGTNATGNQEINLCSVLSKINFRNPSICLLGNLHSGVFPSSIDRTITYRFNNTTQTATEKQENSQLFLVPETIIDTRVIVAKQYIDQNILKNISCEDVAKQCYISTRHLNRLFMECEHFSVKQYINAKKIAEIEKLLRTSEMTLKQISDLFGFCNEFYFNTFFKKNTSITPGEYRKLTEQY